MINNLLRRGLYVFAASFFLVIPIQSKPYTSQRRLTQNKFSRCIQANGLSSCLKKGREFKNLLFTKTDESNQQSYTHIFHAKSYKNNVMYEVTLLDLSREDFQQILKAKTAIFNQQNSSWILSEGSIITISPSGKTTNIQFQKYQYPFKI